MKNSFLAPGAILFVAVVLTSCEKENTTPAQPVLISASGNIQDEVDAFRSMLGPLNTLPGATGGHREINWDGVPADLENIALPSDLFNPVGEDAVAAMQRGLVYSSTGAFMVSSDGFAAVNADASSEFTAFSGSKTFANTTLAAWEVRFQKAGVATAASVQAFGMVFSDVDEDNTTSLEFFDGDKSLGKYFVPPHDASGAFSFLAVKFDSDQRISKVLVTHDGFLAAGSRDVSDGGTNDLIVVDDFIYSEPVEQ